MRAVNPMRREERRKDTENNIRFVSPSVRPSSVLCQRPRFCHPDVDAGISAQSNRLTDLLLRDAATVTSHRRVYGPISATGGLTVRSRGAAAGCISTRDI